jgi:hypothetical protein
VGNTYSTIALRGTPKLQGQDGRVVWRVDLSECGRSVTTDKPRFVRTLARDRRGKGKASKARRFVVARIQESVGNKQEGSSGCRRSRSRRMERHRNLDEVLSTGRRAHSLGSDVSFQKNLRGSSSGVKMRETHPPTHPQGFTAKNPHNAMHCRGWRNKSGRLDLNQRPPAPEAGQYTNQLRHSA